VTSLTNRKQPLKNLTKPKFPMNNPEIICINQ
jgi:hypothetical protein